MRLSTLCIALLLALFSACSTPEQPTAPAGEMLRFVSIDDSSVDVQWSDPAFDHAIVSWESESGQELGHIESTGMSARIEGLDADESYVVVVRERTSGGIGRLIRSRLGRRSDVANATALEASSYSATSVGLRWTPSTTVGATYRIVYGQIDAAGAPIGATQTISNVTGSSTVVTGLSQVVAGGAYRFTVQTVSGTSVSNGASINWAPANRFTRDALIPSVTLRMYEFSSSSGAGMVLDPAQGGPKNITVRIGGPTPGAVALAIFNKVSADPIRYTDSFDIGPAYALVGFANADNFDSTSYISRVGFDVASLNDLYVGRSLESYIDAGGFTAGNISAFVLPNNKPDGKGVAFFMRIGNGSNRHYLRVLVKNFAGKLLQGSGIDRFVEVELSYQAAANVPYAKGVVRTETPATYHAHQ